jgi:hypothetical protein
MGTAAVLERIGVRHILVAAAALCTLVVLASPQAARSDNGALVGGCGYEPVHPFLRWLDPLPYTLLPGGDFESGAAGWTLAGGARVADGNEPFFASSSGDSRSLLLPAGSSATSPRMCMELVLPVVRFFSMGGTGLSYMQVDALYTDAAGRERSIMLLPIGLPSKAWIPNLPMLQLGGTLNALTLNGLTSEISLRFTPKALLFGGGTWRIDDIYVDPWKNG